MTTVFSHSPERLNRLSLDLVESIGYFVGMLSVWGLTTVQLKALGRALVRGFARAMADCRMSMKGQGTIAGLTAQGWRKKKNTAYEEDLDGAPISLMWELVVHVAYNPQKTRAELEIKFAPVAEPHKIDEALQRLYQLGIVAMSRGTRDQTQYTLSPAAMKPRPGSLPEPPPLVTALEALQKAILAAAATVPTSMNDERSDTRLGVPEVPVPTSLTDGTVDTQPGATTRADYPEVNQHETSNTGS